MIAVRDLFVENYGDFTFYDERVLSNKDTCFQCTNDQF